MKILVCGGAGYIGSHLVRELVRNTSHKVVVVDALIAGVSSAKHLEESIIFEQGDVRNEQFLDRVFGEHRPDAVVHMCASIVVPDSVRDPLSYYDNNVVGSLRILQAMKKYDCKYMVFSSTAALFGTPTGDRVGLPIEPDAECKPDSPYGDTKLVMERMLKAADVAHGVRYVCLRYFNACGAHEDGDIGETHDPESHLIPIILQVPLGQRENISIFGDDYPTKDGTCVRDYVHITDLADAHIRAMEYLEKGGVSNWFNLGCGQGFSVREVIEVARKVTGHPIPEEIKPRRQGDPPMLVASAKKANDLLGWKPTFSLDGIIASAWKFHKAHPKGYKD